MTGPETPHSFPIRVYYEDTDMGGVVYHANYLKYIERARSDWVRQAGLDQNAMRAEGLIFVVTRVTAEFLSPARLDDALAVTTRPVRATGVRLVMAQEVAREGRVLFRAEVEAVCTTLEGRPARLPAEIRRDVPREAPASRGA